VQLFAFQTQQFGQGAIDVAKTNKAEIEGAESHEVSREYSRNGRSR
jgi:hypothetical protein